MNREDIISMAHKSHLDVYGLGTDYAKFADALERFAELVRADEREACAKVCEDFADQDSGPDGICTDYHAHLIRARGETK